MQTLGSSAASKRKAVPAQKSLSAMKSTVQQSVVSESAWSPDDFVVGIDEAGRGPVIGPMVYCAFAVRASDLELLKSYGVNDSKALSAAKRDSIFAKITDARSPFMDEVDVVGPDEISRCMSSHREGVNLNSLSHNSAIALLKRYVDKKVPVKAVYVDTVGDATKYEQKLQKLFPSIRIVVSTKADAKFVCVGAASIVAKVTRDRKIEEIEKFYGVPLGCGYPSDPITVKFLKKAVRPFEGFNERHLRLRWKTCENLLESTPGVIKVTFDEPEKKPFQRKQFSSLKRPRKA